MVGVVTESGMFEMLKGAGWWLMGWTTETTESAMIDAKQRDPRLTFVFGVFFVLVVSMMIDDGGFAQESWMIE